MRGAYSTPPQDNHHFSSLARSLQTLKPSPSASQAQLARATDHLLSECSSSQGVRHDCMRVSKPNAIYTVSLSVPLITSAALPSLISAIPSKCQHLIKISSMKRERFLIAQECCFQRVRTTQLLQLWRSEVQGSPETRVWTASTHTARSWMDCTR